MTAKYHKDYATPDYQKQRYARLVEIKTARGWRLKTPEELSEIARIRNLRVIARRDPSETKKIMEKLHTETVTKKRAELSMAKGENHEKAQAWSLKSPDGRIHQFKNLRKFVRDNPALFDSEDVKLRPRTGHGMQNWSRAITGLAALSPRRKECRLTYKGWMWHVNTEPDHIKDGWR